MVRIGLIGAGRIGTNHASILVGLPGVGELLISDVVAGRAEQLATRLGARVASLQEQFAECDALVIASPTDTHAALLMQAAAAGKATFCEKPIDLDLVRTREAVTAVEAAGITVQMGFQRRYDPAIREIRRHIEGAGPAVPFLVRSQTHDPAPPPLDYIPHSGGIFKDCLIHDIDVVRFVTGQEVVSVRAAGTTVGHPDIAELDDYGTATASFEMSGGTLAQISGMRLDPVGYDVRLEAFAPNGAWAAGWSDRTPIVSTEPGVGAGTNPITTFWERFDAAYRAELEAFLRVVAGEEDPASDHRDAYEDLRVAEACSRAAREQRAVAMEEIE